MSSTSNLAKNIPSKLHAYLYFLLFDSVVHSQMLEMNSQTSLSVSKNEQHALISVPLSFSVNIDQIRQHVNSIKPAPAAGNPPKATVRRQNSRRHTLTSGVDYNTVSTKYMYIRRYIHYYCIKSDALCF